MKMIVTKALCLLFFFLPATKAEAHTGSAKGHIYDGGTHKPLEGAGIYFKEINISAVTNGFGSFFLKNINDGRYTVIISHIGYETSEERITIEDGVTTDFTVNLQPAAVTMKEVTINSRSDLNLSSISNVDLKLRPINSTQDMLRMVPGLFLAQHQGGGKAEQIFLRGFDVDHGTDVHVSVDGMPVNMVSHAHGQGYADAHFIIPEAVDKLDFGKGPYRIDKGNLATAGWVEFKTKDYLANSFAKTEGGMYDYFRTAAGFNLLDRNTGLKNQEAYIIGDYNYNRSYFDAPQNLNRFNLVAKYTNYLAKDKILRLTLSGFGSNWEASGQVPQRAVTAGLIGRLGEIDGEGGKTSRYNANIQYFQAINNNSYFKSNVYIGHYSFDLYSNFTFFLEDSLLGDQIHQAENRTLTGYNAAYTTHYHIGKLHTRTETGIALRYDDISGAELSHTANRTTIINRLAYGDINETNVSGYVNQSFDILPQLVINAGTRFDYFIHSYDNKLATEPVKSTYNTKAFSPKAGIYYNFNDNARIYANYGVGFHSNDTRVITGHAARDILPLARSYDLGIVIKPYSKLLVSTAVWMMDLQQEFVYSGDAAIVEPSGKTRRMGADISIRYDLFKWLYMDADFNYTKARYTDEPAGNDYVPLTAGITSIGGATVKVNKHLSAGLRFRHMGDRPANEDNSVVAAGYTIFDMVANYTRKHYELGLQVQNLFNRSWNEAQFDTETRLRNEPAPVSEICFTPGTPFFIKLSATYKF